MPDDADKDEYYAKVFYTENNDKFKPHLGLIVGKSDPENSPLSPKSLGLVDSGADETILPYSIGVLIGLEGLRPGEEPYVVGGVGGGMIYCIVRECSIFLVNEATKKIYQFKEMVWWKIPTPELKKEREDLIEKLRKTAETVPQARTGTALHQAYKKQVEVLKDSIKKINENLEGEIIIGRPFFDNFNYIQFNHTDREKEDTCFFTYQVKKEKVISEKPLE